jgi:hypothetical protein
VTIKVSQAVTGLQPGVTYHYRVIATGPGGSTVKGADRTFTTPKIPLSVQIAAVPNPVLFGDPFFVEGTLSGTGASTHEIVLQANRFPYLGGFKDVGNSEVASSAGGFSFPYVGLLENAQLRVVTVGSPVVASPVVLESVAVRVSFHVRRARRRGFVRLYGDVAPAEVGALVGFQLLAPGTSINEGGHRRHSRYRQRLASQPRRASAPPGPVSRADQGRRRRARVQLQRADPDSLRGAAAGASLDSWPRPRSPQPPSSPRLGLTAVRPRTASGRSGRRLAARRSRR